MPFVHEGKRSLSLPSRANNKVFCMLVVVGSSRGLPIKKNKKQKREQRGRNCTIGVNYHPTFATKECILQHFRSIVKGKRGWSDQKNIIRM